MNFNEKIIIGSVHFGMPYGLKEGKESCTSKIEIKKILSIARNNKILNIDTAMNYGKAEKNLGVCGVNGFKIISKIYIEQNILDLEQYIFSQIETTLNNLGVNSLQGLLVHNPTALLSEQGKRIYSYLLKAKEIYKINKIGISAHHFYEIKPIIKKFKIDIVQLPFNVFDQRAIKNKLFNYFKSNKIEIHARSIFLQGLLLYSTNELPEQFLKWKSLFHKFDNFVKNYNISKLEACINYVNSFKEIDKFVVGIRETKELEKILSVKIKKLGQLSSDFASNDLSLIDPSNWKKINFNK